MSNSRALIPRFLHFWRTSLAKSASTRVGVAVSAGCDSCVLAAILARLRPHLGIRKLVLLHLDHGIRPAAERRRDMEVLRRLAKRTRATLVVGRARVRARGKGLEDAARAARLAFFARAARRFKLGAVAVAHHLDDRIETFFLFLLRGSGSRGLSSLRAVETLTRPGPLKLIRPILPFTREEIRKFAESGKIEHHEDSTNLDPRFLRNRIRMELVPRLGEWSPGFRRAMAATISVLESEDAALSELAESILQSSIDAGSAPPAPQVPMSPTSAGSAPRPPESAAPQVPMSPDQPLCGPKCRRLRRRPTSAGSAKKSITLDRRRLRMVPAAVLARVLQQADRSIGGSGLLGGHENLSAAVRAILGKSTAQIDLPGGRVLRIAQRRVYV